MEHSPTGWAEEEMDSVDNPLHWFHGEKHKCVLFLLCSVDLVMLSSHAPTTFPHRNGYVLNC